jgi:hypothetical protein
MSTIRDGLKEFIGTRSERQVLALWRVAASMRPSAALTPDEAGRVNQALKEIEAGDFVEWSDLEPCPLV